MKYLFTILCLSIAISSFAQFYEATVDENYHYKITKSQQYSSEARNNPDIFDQLSGFPKSFRADINNKNFRNVTLADINQDGIEEILFAAQSKLFAFSGATLLWEKVITGTGIYPPSVGDINGDGQVEIVQVTGGNGRKGRIYIVDSKGKNIDGFPKNYNDNWILTAPTLSDLNDDGKLEVIFIERNSPGGFIHILNGDGSTYSADWPIRLPGTPSVTPSIGDIDNDGEKDIIVSSTTVLYAFDLKGQLKEGWPVNNPDTKFSFQSPILSDLDEDGTLEIIGASHGNSPEYYIFRHNGTPYKAWPFFVPNREWTFSTPTVVEIDGVKQIFMSRPIKSAATDMLYSWAEAGDLVNGFPIEKEGGLEGIISVADVDNDGEMELVFGSNRLDTLGYGFIHAFNMDGSGEVEGFPLRPKGWTLMNGAALGDIDGDGQMDLSALSYTLGLEVDSIYLNVYNLNVSYHPKMVVWNTYKGSNTRDGNIGTKIVSSNKETGMTGLTVSTYPNPTISNANIKITLSQKEKLTAQIYTVEGKLLINLFDESFQKGTYQKTIPKLPPGIYFLKVTNQHKKAIFNKIVAIKN